MAGKMLNPKQDFEISPDLLSKTAGRLGEIPDPTEEDFEDIPQLDDKESEVKPEDEDRDLEKDEDLEEDEDLDEDEDLEEDDEVEEGEKDKKEKDLPPLPDNYYRAAVHAGWSPEDIHEFYQADPDRAVKTFGKIYDSINYVTRETAALGRAHHAQAEQLRKLEESKKAPQEEYKGIDVEAFAKEFGEENPAVVELLKALNEQNVKLYKEISEIKGQQQQAATEPPEEELKLWQEINDFFNDKDLEVFSDFYGKIKPGQQWDEALTGEQLRRRMEVLRYADQFKSGAALQGNDVSYREALQRAHLILSDEIRDSIVRESLRKQIKKRSKGLTVKSTGRRFSGSEDAGKPEGEEVIIKRARNRLKKIFGGNVE